MSVGVACELVALLVVRTLVVFAYFVASVNPMERLSGLAKPCEVTPSPLMLHRVFLLHIATLFRKVPPIQVRFDLCALWTNAVPTVRGCIGYDNHEGV